MQEYFSTDICNNTEHPRQNTPESNFGLKKECTLYNLYKHYYENYGNPSVDPSPETIKFVQEFLVKQYPNQSRTHDNDFDFKFEPKCFEVYTKVTLNDFVLSP